MVEAWRAMLRRIDPDAYHRHQIEAMRAIVDHVGTPGNAPTALTIIPTAGGKTRIFLAQVEALRAAGADRGVMPNVIVLVPTRNLIQQTLDGFTELFPDVDVGVVASGMGSRIRPVTLMSYAGFTAMAQSGQILPEDVDCLVMDEAHRGLSDLRQSVLDGFKERCVVTAFSATPSFDDEKKVQNLLGPENEVFNIPAQVLRDRGVIAPVVNYVLGIKIDGKPPADGLLRTQAKRKAVVDLALDFIAEHVDGQTVLANKIAVFYGADRAHARMFAAEYNRRLGPGGRRMVVVTGEDGPDRVAEISALVRSGAVTAVGNARLLQEGWDLPEVGLVVNSPTSSLVLQLQQSGRAQRIDRGLPAESPEQTAYVVDTYLRVNGRIQGRPRFFFEASGEVGMGRHVDMPAIDFGAIGLDGFLGDEYLPEQVDSDTPSLDEPEGSEALPAAPLPSTGQVAALPPPEGPGSGAGPTEPTGGTPQAGHPDPAPAPNPHRPRTEPRFRVSGGLDIIVRMLKERDKDRDSVRDAPPIQNGWGGLVEAAARLEVSIDNPALRRVWDALEEEVRRGRPAILDGVTLSASLRRSGPRTFLAMPHEEIDFVGRIIGATPGLRDKDGDWLTFKEAGAAVSATSSPLLRTCFLDLAAQWRRDREARLPDGTGVRFELVRYATKRVFALHRDDVPLLQAHLDTLRPPRRRADELTLADAAARLGIKHPSLVTFWQGMAEALRRGEPILDGDRPVRARIATPAKGSDVAVLHEGELDWLRGRLDRKLTGTVRPGPGWLTLTDAATELKVSPDGPLAELWAGLRAQAETGDLPTLDGVPVRHAWIRNKAKISFGLSREELDRVRQSLGIGRVLDAVPAGYLSFTQACVEIGAAPHAADMRAALAEIEEAVAAGTRYAHGNESAKVVQARNGTRTAIYLSEEACRLLAKAAGRSWRGESFGLPPQGEDWLAKGPVARALGVNATLDRRFNQAWNELVRQLEAGKRPSLGDVPFAFERRRGKTADVICLNLADLGALAASLGRKVRNPPPGWKETESLVEAAGFTP